MARRTVSGGDYVTEVIEAGGLRLWQEMPGRDYISHLCREPMICGLLWREVKRMMRWASSPSRGPGQLTEWQATVLECYFIGNEDWETAAMFKCSRQNVEKARRAGLIKIDRYKPRQRGVLTVMCETFSWPQIREHLADLAEEWADRQMRN